MSFEIEKALWAKRQARRSQRPLEYWASLAIDLWRDRSQFDNNPNLPIGRWAYHNTYYGAAAGIMVDRNLKGIDLEKQGRIEDAMRLYELNIADEFSGTHPSDRLRILYTRQQNYVEAIRVCQTYLATLDRLEKTWPGYPNLRQRPKLREQIAKLQAKLDKTKQRC